MENRYYTNLWIIAYSVWNTDKNTYQPFKQRLAHWEPDEATALELEMMGKDIIEEVDEYYIENCSVSTESGDDGKWLIVEDAPDYENLLCETIDEYAQDNSLTEQEKEWLTEYVNDIKSDVESLDEQAMDNYRDRLDDDGYNY